MRQHTAEPWRVGYLDNGQTAIHGASGLVAALEAGYQQKRDADAARIVASVNACKGIPTAVLSEGLLEELIQACKGMSQYFYCTMNPARMPATAKRTFDLMTRMEAARERAGE
jgi:hypothetical protein